MRTPGIWFPALLVIAVLLLSGLAPLTSGIYIGKRIAMDIADNRLSPGAVTVVTITVKDSDGNPVDLLRVNVSATAGSFDDDWKTTNQLGKCVFHYTAPGHVPAFNTVTLTASCWMGGDEFTAEGTVKVYQELSVEVQGPRQLAVGGEQTEYVVQVTAGGMGVHGASVTVENTGVGTVDEVGPVTGEDGSTWFRYTPPADETGNAALFINVSHGDYEDAHALFNIQILEEVAPLVLTVVADRDPLPVWGSCNLTATVTSSDEPVEGAYVTWGAEGGWLSDDDGNTDAAGTLSVVYTAMGETDGMWAPGVNVTVGATDGFTEVEEVLWLDFAPYDPAFNAEVDLRTSGGQLFPGEELRVRAGMTLAEGSAWEFITPLSVQLVWWREGGGVDQRVLAEDLSIEGPFDWSSDWERLLTVPDLAVDDVYRVRLQVVSANGVHVHWETAEPLDITILPTELEDEWTVMVFLNGDNDLNCYADYWFDRFESWAPGEDEFPVVVQYDRHSSQKGYARWTETRRYRLTEHYMNEELDSHLLMTMDEVDSGSADSVEDFVLWASELYPAGHYHLDIWDHGGSYLGCSVDIRSDTDIENSELREALLDFGSRRRSLDVLSFDACLMSSLEVAHQFKDVAEYLVASETVINTDMLVREFLGMMRDHWPDDRPSALHVATDVINGYLQKVELHGGELFPFAVSDLGYVSTVESNLDDLADALIARWDAVEDLVWDARFHSQKVKGPYSNTIWLVDAYDYFQNLKGLLEDHPGPQDLQDAVDACDRLLTSLGNLAFYMIPVEDHHGVHICFPDRSASWYHTRDEYVRDGMPEGGGWVRILDSFFFGPPEEEEDPPGFFPLDATGFTDAPLQQVGHVVQDQSGDGSTDTVDVDFELDNQQNLAEATLVVDLVAHNGSRAAGMEGLVDREVRTVAAGGRIEGRVSLTSPVEDRVDLVYSVLTGEGEPLQAGHLASFTIDATPREGSPPALSVEAVSGTVVPGQAVELSCAATDPDGDQVTLWWDLDCSDGVGIDATTGSVTLRPAVPGNLTVTCIATDGGHVVVERLRLGVEEDPADRSPVANLAHAFVDGRTVRFDAGASSDPDGDDLSFQLNLGDGNWTSWSTGPRVTHAYGENGTYLVVLRVAGSNRELTASTSVQVTVPGSPPNEPPTPALLLDAPRVRVGQQVSADASASHDPDAGDTLRYRWDWGDGNVSDWSRTGVASHTYGSPGTYTITLRVTDGEHTRSITEDVSVKEVEEVEDGGIPGPGAPMVAAALVMAWAVSWRLRGSGTPPPSRRRGTGRRVPRRPEGAGTKGRSPR